MNQADIRRLLGTEVAQNDPNFLRYAVKKSGVLDMLRNPENRFQIINAARGSGKSALLICHERDILDSCGPNNVIIKKYHADAPLPTNLNDFHSSLNFWKNTLLGWLVSDIGTLVKSPVDNDEVAAANYAEKIGKREIDAVLAQLRANEEPDKKILYNQDLSDSYISRLVDKSRHTFWILLDEMDDYYENIPKFNQRLIGLLKAARHVASLHARIRIRITIRPHIMTSLMRTADVGSTFRGDILDLRWNEKELLRLLARRIQTFEGYSSEQSELFVLDSSETHTERDELEQQLARYFDPFDASFSQGKQSGYRALLTFSLERPRWVIEFCSLALAYASGQRATVGDFKKAAAEFGRNRVIFLAGEHAHHFPDLEQVVNQIASARKVRFGSATGLRDLILSHVVRAGVRPVRREGIDLESLQALEEVAALKVANDLFQIEFIRARQGAGGRDNHRFYTFVERPSLLASWAADPTITWEMHPMFARSLNIIDSQTFSVGGKYRSFGDKKRKKSIGDIESEDVGD